jgi:enoyl-CoA hydratase/carnithine racemase
MAVTHIKCKIESQVAIILLEPPEGKPPTLDSDVLNELAGCIEEVRRQESRIVLVRSTSERFFCVGANINVLQHTNEKTIIPWVKQGHRVLNMLEDLPVPVVAVVEGYAIGGGLELAMACDLIFASDNAQLAHSEATLGFVPGWGGTRRLAARIGASKAKYYYYSGKTIDAHKASEIGLVDFAGSKAELERELNDFTAAVIGNNRNAICQFKTILNNQQLKARDENATAEAFRSISCLQDPDTRQRLHDFITKKVRK